LSRVRSLRIHLGEQYVGSLFELADGRVGFAFDEMYATASMRPVLSQSYESAIEANAVAEIQGEGCRELPTFFQNLLPEGALRKHLTEGAGLSPDDELGLLALCGKGLPGDISAVAESLSHSGLPAPSAETISGFQPKVALVGNQDGSFEMRVGERAGLKTGPHFIGKLPVGRREALPEIEHLSMCLAAAAGVQTCIHELRPLAAIKDALPFTVRPEAENFLLVHRFDWDAPTPTGRLHMEDFAQATGTRASEKYKGTYANIGAILLSRSEKGEDDVFELLRRIKVNEMLGNFDAHLKNFSLLYSTPQRASLSPAYDIVAYSAYAGGRGHALKFTSNQKSVANLTPAVLRELATVWGISEKRMSSVVIETVDRAMTTWPAMLEESDIPEVFRTRMGVFLEANESVRAWRKRHSR
jgi:serine/threonine-protein kinase HipA